MELKTFKAIMRCLLAALILLSFISFSLGLNNTALEGLLAFATLFLVYRLTLVRGF